MEKLYHVICYSTQKPIWQEKKVEFTQYDSETSKVEITLFNDVDKPMNDINYCEFTSVRPDNTTYTFGADSFTVADNVITLILPPGAVYAVGKHTGSVAVYGENMQRLTVLEFTYTVIEDLISDTPIDETNEYPILTSLISQVQNVPAQEDTRQANEAVRQTNETNRINAENSRVNTVNSIVSAYDAATKANLSIEVSNARGGFGTLQNRLDNSDLQLSAKAKKQYLFYNDLADPNSSFNTNLTNIIALYKQNPLLKGIVFENDVVVGSNITIDSINDCEFIFKGNVNASTFTTILLTNSNRIKFIANNFNNVSIQLKNVNKVYVNDSAFAITGDNTTDLSAVIMYENCSNVVIDNNVFNSPNGVKGYIPNTDTVSQGKNIVIKNNTFTTKRMGIESFNSFINCYVYDNKFLNVQGNSAISLVGASANTCFIRNNKFYNSETGHTLGSYFEITIDNVIICENLFLNLDTFNLYASAPTGTILFADNKIINCKCTTPMFRRSGKTIIVQGNEILSNNDISIVGDEYGSTYDANSRFFFRNNTIRQTVDYSTLFSLCSGYYINNTITYSGTTAKPLFRANGDEVFFNGNFVKGVFTYVIQSNTTTTNTLIANNTFKGFSKYIYNDTLPTYIVQQNNVLIS